MSECGPKCVRCGRAGWALNRVDQASLTRGPGHGIMWTGMVCVECAEKLRAMIAEHEKNTGTGAPVPTQHPERTMSTQTIDTTATRWAIDEDPSGHLSARKWLPGETVEPSNSFPDERETLLAIIQTLEDPPPAPASSAQRAWSEEQREAARTLIVDRVNESHDPEDGHAKYDPSWVSDTEIDGECAAIAAVAGRFVGPVRRPSFAYSNGEANAAVAACENAWVAALTAQGLKVEGAT